MDIPQLVAEALKDALNTEISGLGAVRQYSGDFEREGAAERQIVVVPSADDLELASRDHNLNSITIDVGILDPIDSNSVDEIDTASDLPKSIKALFGEGGALRGTRMNGYTFAGITHDPLWDPERLAANVYATRLRFEFRANH